jgi:TonB family protein
MVNQTDSGEGFWVHDRLACLRPSPEWQPDSYSAFERFKKRRDLQALEGSPRWIRFSMAAAIVMSIGLIVALLPWHALWRPEEKSRSATPEPAKAATPVVMPVPTPPVQPTPSPRSQPPAVPGVAAEQQNAAPAPEKEQKPAERVGPGVTPPRAIPPIPEPGYTDEARQARIQGTVVLDVIIRADGTGKVNKVVSGLGYGLDEKAVEAFEKWKFVPGAKDGKPVDVQSEVVVNFHLY